MKYLVVVLLLSTSFIGQTAYRDSAARAARALANYREHVRFYPDTSSEREMKLASDEADKLVDRAASLAATDDDNGLQDRLEKCRGDIEDMRAVVDEYSTWVQRFGSFPMKRSRYKALRDRFEDAKIHSVSYCPTP